MTEEMVEEIRDEEEEDDAGDSDSVMEVDTEDPAAAAEDEPGEEEPKKKTASGANIVTIDDVRTLQRLAAASSAKKAEQEKNSLSVIDTNAILAGKATNGVTITPARPKQPGVAGLPSGVTISQSGKSSNTAFGYDSRGQLNDPNLTDDTFVVEAPSFIVPYVYEKPPKETITDFKESVEKIKKEIREKKKLEKDEAKNGEKSKMENGDGSSDSEDDGEGTSKKKKENGDSSKKKNGDGEEGKDDDKSKSSSDDDEIVELKKVEPNAKKSENFFELTLGKFVIDLGMNLVQETVQADLLKQQIRKGQKDKSAAVMHAIMSLRKNLEQSKEHNAVFRFEDLKCRFCSFRTESETVMQHHLETPHMRQATYRCNFCQYDTRLPQEVLNHMNVEHGVRGRLERAPGIHQCPQCSFEDNMKGKLSRHKTSCDKRYRAERNQEPPMDWEPPAKIPKPPAMMRRPGMPQMPGMHGVSQAQGYFAAALRGASATASQFSLAQQQQLAMARNVYAGMPQLQFGPRGRGRPVGTYKPDSRFSNPQFMQRQGLSQFANKGSQLFGNSLMNNQVLQALNQQGRGISSLSNNSSVTIQSVGQRNANRTVTAPPSISITPLPGRSQQNAMAGKKIPPNMMAGQAKPGQPAQAGAQNTKGNFVICEICDGYIKDLEQLRNHMLWIHKVKIHPKMIHNRPPLNCQKCQFRFFTDQGLERHLLGSHGLVTASMQDLANKGQDSGRCPVCGKVYQWKLLNHVSKDHQKTLKPAHLSYKCTVCTATFGQYKLFEAHVYQAHSGASKKTDKSKAAPQGQSSTLKQPFKMPNDITVIPKSGQKASERKDADDVIELDDEEEEIDDVEDESSASKSKKRPPTGGASGQPQHKKARASEAEREDSGEEEGVQEIGDDEAEDE